MSWTITGRGIAAGPLDISGTAAAAYSLRNLSANFTGNVVRVRRSSDNAEQDFTAAQVTNGTLASFCGAGNGFVRTWYDQSGNGRHAGQTTTGNQPQIVNSGAVMTDNTKPRLFFNRTNENRLSFAEVELSPVTVFSVANRSTVNGYHNIVSIGRPSAATDVLTFGVNNDTNYGPILIAAQYNATPGAKGGSVNTDIQRLRTGLWNGGTVSDAGSYAVWDNGSAVSLVSTGASTVGLANSVASLIGATYSVGTIVSYWGGNIQELVIYGSNQSSSRTAIESNINAYYAIY